MNYFEQNRDFYDQPAHLTEEQRKEPLKVIESFFSDYDLSEVRESLGALLEVALTSENLEFSEPGQRADVLYFCKQLEELIEAAFILNCRNENKG
jgi:hypothetical protein